VGFQGILHQRAVAAGENYATRHGLEAGTVEAIPQPFSPFHWMIVIPQKNEYHMAYVSLWRDEIPEFPPEDANWLRQVHASYYPVRDALWKQVPRFGLGKDAKLAEELWYSEVLSSYRNFALFPALYGVDRIQGRLCVWFNDLRFALAGRDMPFRYGACRTGKDAAWRVYRLLNDDSGEEIFEAIPH
jgi:inner membrane protein